MESQIKNLKKAAQRLKLAGKKKEKVIIYGDADLDGVASVIIMQETLENLGADIAAVYFPDREIEGYGITMTALKKLKKFSPALLVAVDLGIGNFAEVEAARNLGFETIIIDHHEILDDVPNADIIIDPKQPIDHSSFKLFSAAGLVFKTAQEALGKNLSPRLRINFLELAALATIADMMPREGENQKIINEGIADIARSFRPGIRVFFEKQNFYGKNIDKNNINKTINWMISILNVRDMHNGIPAAYRLLRAKSIEEAKGMIGDFITINEQRRQEIKSVVAQMEAHLANCNEPIIFEGSDQLDLNIAGTVASIICQKYQKPTFIYKILQTESQGTVRSPATIDSVALMKKCKNLLITFGGHPKASGFRLQNKNIAAFKQCLLANIANINNQ